ncbi:MAG: hypothetical protein C4520_00740 [Candidatus Abyssobacteria bacterium SURF_5]|uniref:Uncharacterized protein n=1 Tax=Abyssobacteria bacterium (strain SURF_5) TaxID=2093360 RepID=A0A3A4P0T7_ABYX5|nr:MAG: hypothetical protein C4520_00740 [Candidatus Abyssubacteria bacterium SURF_5]
MNERVRAKRTKKYIHFPLHVPMEIGASSYWISAEERIQFRDREVLCIVRDTERITSCCGESAGLRSIGVMGYITCWHAGIIEQHHFSILEPISDKGEQMELSRLLRAKYGIAQVEFL